MSRKVQENFALCAAVILELEQLPHLSSHPKPARAAPVRPRRAQRDKDHY